MSTFAKRHAGTGRSYLTTRALLISNSWSTGSVAFSDEDGKVEGNPASGVRLDATHRVRPAHLYDPQDHGHEDWLMQPPDRKPA
jgi:hypothetical protein